MSAGSELLFLVAVVWCLFWTLVATRSRASLVVVCVIGAVHWFLAALGVYTNASTFPPPQIALLAPVLVALGIVLLWPKGRVWMSGLSLFALTAVHVLRIPVELVLHHGYEAGLVPRDMTYAGYNFDIVSGITAVIMALWMLSKRPPGRGVLIAWNLACLALLFIVVITAVLSIPSSVQRMNFDVPNVLVTTTPWVLLPGLLVPVVLWAHVAALVQLRTRR